MSRVRVSIAEVRNIQKRRCKINSLDLANIEWIDAGGQIIKIDPNIVQQWRFTGLNNIDFVDFVIDGNFAIGRRRERRR